MHHGPQPWVGVYGSKEFVATPLPFTWDVQEDVAEDSYWEWLGNRLSSPFLSGLPLRVRYFATP